MIRKILFFFCCLFHFGLQAQDKTIILDKSTLDISYFPANFPLLKVQEKATAPLQARLIYSRPAMNGRVVFGDLIAYDKIWRLGANEATEIEFYQDVSISNSRLKKGRYTLYAIPQASKWTILINKETDTWGSFRYNINKEVFKTDLPVEKITEVVEYFTMYFEATEKGMQLLMLWENAKVVLPIETSIKSK
jgi:hypothetical protein